MTAGRRKYATAEAAGAYEVLGGSGFGFRGLVTLANAAGAVLARPVIQNGTRHE